MIGNSSQSIGAIFTKAGACDRSLSSKQSRSCSSAVVSVVFFSPRLQKRCLKSSWAKPCRQNMTKHAWLDGNLQVFTHFNRNVALSLRCFFTETGLGSSSMATDGLDLRRSLRTQPGSAASSTLLSACGSQVGWSKRAGFLSSLSIHRCSCSPQIWAWFKCLSYMYPRIGILNASTSKATFRKASKQESCQTWRLKS